MCRFMQDGRVNVMYSTPRIYADAKKSYNISWPLHSGDMFPYADCPNCYWTGESLRSDVVVPLPCMLSQALSTVS